MCLLEDKTEPKEPLFHQRPVDKMVIAQNKEPRGAVTYK